jgi:uncharacterized membrane protein YfcA
MPNESALLLFCGALFLISLLYSCVGQAGASGYIAAMALFGFAPAAIKPTALVLNVLVSVVVSIRFYRAGYFSWQLFWPLALASVPPAILGGSITLPAKIFNGLLGALLLVAAIPLLFRRDSEERPVSLPRVPLAMITGATIGLLSGLTGVGGGVLITPILLHCRWARAKEAAAVSAAFIFVNSVAALAGRLTAVKTLPSGLWLFAISVALGGSLGAFLGSARLSALTVYRLLGTILLIAGCKLLFV